MEVHAHTHTPRKKWTHYFWEFLMLFLAVFCGFLAEYQLEHKIEHDREKQFMHSMLKDLELDTVTINFTMNGNTGVLNGIDTLLDLIAKPTKYADFDKNLFLLLYKIYILVFYS